MIRRGPLPYAIPPHSTKPAHPCTTAAGDLPGPAEWHPFTRHLPAGVHADRSRRLRGVLLPMGAGLGAWGRAQGSRIRVYGPMLWVISEASGSPEALTEPAKDETSAQT